MMRFLVSADAIAVAVLRLCGARRQQSVSRSESRPRSIAVEWWHLAEKYCIKRQDPWPVLGGVLRQ